MTSARCSRWSPVIVRHRQGGCANFGAAPIGRRSGKIRMAAAVALPHRSADRSQQAAGPGREWASWRCIAASRDQASTVFNYIKGFLMSSPLLAGQVESINRDEIMLRGDIVISVVTNSFRIARGMTLLAVHWRRSFVTGKTKRSAMPDIETYRAMLPSAGGVGRFVGRRSRTGYRRQGCCSRSTAIISVATATTCWRSSGRPKCSTRLIDPALIAQGARRKTRKRAEAEWGGGFRRDIAAFLSRPRH